MARITVSQPVPVPARVPLVHLVSNKKAEATPVVAPPDADAILTRREELPGDLHVCFVDWPAFIPARDKDNPKAKVVPACVKVCVCRSTNHLHRVFVETPTATIVRNAAGAAWMRADDVRLVAPFLK